MNHDAADLSSVFNINLIDVPLNLTITEHDTQLENTGNSLEEKFLDLFHIRYTYEALPYQKYAIEDSIITWFDEEFQKKDTNYFHLITQTRQITNDVKIFDTLDFLCNYIKQVIDEKVFLVVSGPVDETLWSFACNSPQIASIYIFCTLKTFGEKSNIQHSKLKGVYTEFDSLYDQLKYDVKQYENNLIQFRTLNSSITNLFDPRNQYQSLLSYYFFKYLKNILNNLDKNTHDYSEMIAFYRERYAKNYSALYKIDEFQHEYEPNYAISWYIKCSFLYRIINHALRTQNMCVLYKFRYFIKDLHDQFQLQLTQSINHWKGTVYRGECLSMENLEEYSVGCNVMYNSYLPASFCKKVALAFTSSVPNKSDFKSVLFRIDIDTDSPSSYCFACIADTNRMKDEEEVLFSIGTIFRINSIIDETDSGGPYIIDLTLDTDEKLPKLATVMQYYSKELYGWSQIGQLLLQMGNYTRAQQFFQVLLERGNRDEDQAACADILHQLGYTFHRNNDFDRALRFYKQAVQLSQESIEHMRALVATYYNIGSIYRQQKNYELSIEFFEKVHATIMKLSQFAQQSGASCQDLSDIDNRANMDSAKLKEITINRNLIVDHTCLIVWLTLDDDNSGSGHLLSEVKDFFSDIIILHNRTELDHLMLAFQFVDKPLYLIVSNRNDEEIKALIFTYKKYLQALYVIGNETRRPTNDEDVERGVFNSRLSLIYRLATDIAGRYQLFGDEEFDFGDTNNGQNHYQNAVDLYQKLAKCF